MPKAPTGRSTSVFHFSPFSCALCLDLRDPSFGTGATKRNIIRPRRVQELHDMKPVVDRILHESRELSLRHQRCDPLDDFKRCIEAINNRHTSNVVSRFFLESPVSRGTAAAHCTALYYSTLFPKLKITLETAAAAAAARTSCRFRGQSIAVHVAHVLRRCPAVYLRAPYRYVGGSHDSLDYRLRVLPSAPNF